MDEGLAELVGLLLEGMLTGAAVETPAVPLARAPHVNERYSSKSRLRLRGTVVTPDRKLAARFTATLEAGDVVVVRGTSVAHRKALVAIEDGSSNTLDAGSEPNHALVVDFAILLQQFELVAQSG